MVSLCIIVKRGHWVRPSLEHHSYKICSSKFCVVDSECSAVLHGSGSHGAKQHVSHRESLWGSSLSSSGSLCDWLREAGITSGPILGGTKESSSRARVSAPPWEQRLVALHRTWRMVHCQPSHGAKDAWLVPIPARIPKSFPGFSPACSQLLTEPLSGDPFGTANPVRPDGIDFLSSQPILLPFSLHFPLWCKTPLFVHAVAQARKFPAVLGYSLWPLGDPHGSPRTEDSVSWLSFLALATGLV